MLSVCRRLGCGVITPKFRLCHHRPGEIMPLCRLGTPNGGIISPIRRVVQYYDMNDFMHSIKLFKDVWPFFDLKLFQRVCGRGLEVLCIWREDKWGSLCIDTSPPIHTKHIKLSLNTKSF